MRSNFCFGVTLIGVACLVALIPRASAIAQPTSNNAAPVCMSRPANSGAPINIILPASNAGALRKKGFEIVPCEKHFGALDQRENYRDLICLAASKRSQSLQETYERHLGERPAVLCGMAELAISRWKRGGSK